MGLFRKMKSNKLRGLSWIAFFISVSGLLSIAAIIIIVNADKVRINPESLTGPFVLCSLICLFNFFYQYFSSKHDRNTISQIADSVSQVEQEIGSTITEENLKEIDMSAISASLSHSLQSLNEKESQLKLEIELNQRISENIAEFYRQMKTLREADLKFDFYEYEIKSSVFVFISGMITAFDDEVELSEITGQCLFNNYGFSITYEEFKKLVEKSIQSDEPINFECSVKSKNDKIRWLKLWGRLSKDKTLITGAITDITREVLGRNIEKERAIHDNITGFYNRNALSEIAEKAISESAEDEHVVFVYIGLTGYQEFQERFGMVAGNTYIRVCADVFKKFLNESMIPVRWWGSDFLVIFKRVKCLENFEKECLSINDKIEKYIGEVDGVAVTFPLATGYSVYSLHGRTPSELLEYAAFAEHEALRGFMPSPNEFNRERFEEARKASLRRTFIKDIIDQNQLSVVFQPIVSLRTGDIFGFEALSRPGNPIYNNILELIDDAEASGHYAILEKRMMFNALDAYMERHDKFKDQYLFINTAPYATLDEKDYNDIRDRYFGHMKVVFEVIERNRMEPDEINLRKSIVTKAGAKFALDDFGSGYSNHLALLALEPDIIKIDRELVRGIDDDLRKQHMLEDTISYARYRGTRVLAEGVETQGELETLCRMGIDYAQGYFTGRPDPRLLEPNAKAQEIIRSISRNNQININQVYIIIEKSTAIVSENLAKSLSITTYLMLKMGKVLGFEGEKLSSLVITSMIHDVGEIYAIYENKDSNRDSKRSDHAIFAYLLIKEFFPYPEYARMVLYHHKKYNKDVSAVNNIAIPDEAYLLSLSNTVSELILSNSKPDKLLSVLNERTKDSHKPEYVMLFEGLIDEGILDQIYSGEYREVLFTYFASLKICKAEIESIIRTFIYAVTFRTPLLYSHARSMESTASILARMTKQNWNLLEKVRIAALLYNLGMLAMDKEELEKQHSPEEMHSLLSSGLGQISIILKEAGLIDIMDMLNGVVGDRNSSEKRVLMSKDIINGSNMLNLADIFSTLIELRLKTPDMTCQDVFDELKRISQDGSLYLPIIELMEDFIEDIEARINSNSTDIAKRYQNIISGMEKLRTRIREEL